MVPDLRIDQAAFKSLQKALKQANPELQKELRKELKDAAGIVATAAKGNVKSVSGRAAGSIRAGSTAKGAYVAGGKSSVPYYGWLDFGGRTPIFGRSRSDGPWKGSGKGPHKGRFLYPAFAEKHADVERAVRDAISKSINRLF